MTGGARKPAAAAAAAGAADVIRLVLPATQRMVMGGNPVQIEGACGQGG